MKHVQSATLCVLLLILNLALVQRTEALAQLNVCLGVNGPSVQHNVTIQSFQGAESKIRLITGLKLPIYTFNGSSIKIMIAPQFVQNLMIGSNYRNYSFESYPSRITEKSNRLTAPVLTQYTHMFKENFAVFTGLGGYLTYTVIGAGALLYWLGAALTE